MIIHVKSSITFLVSEKHFSSSFLFFDLKWWPSWIPTNKKNKIFLEGQMWHLQTNNNSITHMVSEKILKFQKQSERKIAC